MSRWLRTGVVAGAAVAACKFTAGQAPTDGKGPADVLVDAGPCTTVGTTSCSADMLLTCTTMGQLPTMTPCAWGCVSTGSAHCGFLSPTGGGVVGSDTDPTTFTGLHPNVSVSGMIDGSAGTVEGLGSGSDFQYHLHGGVAVFRFKSFTVTGDVTLVGPYAIALVADGNITISADIDAQGPCTGNTPGPGGFAGAASTGTAIGSGAGVGGGGSKQGGGGGGNGGSGGTASSGADAGGPPFDSLTVLVGGGGGGGAAGAPGHGGGGGGAIQLASNGTISIGSAGSINAGGCGGLGGNVSNDGGGGGGAGGTILIEALMISIGGQLEVNGGGGGGGDAGTDGNFAMLGRTQAAGGTSSSSGQGGSGAAGSAYVGGSTPSNSSNGAGGGGGGIGRIRLGTKNGSATVDNTMMSPALNDPMSPAVSGSATVQ